MAEVYRLDEGDSKLARDLLDPLRKFRNEYDRIVQAREKIAQAEDKPTGTLSVRSSVSAGMVTLISGHAIVTGQLFTLTWAGGARTSVVAGDVSGQNVPFTGGAGIDLPAQDTAITATHYKTAAYEMSAKDIGGVASPNDAYKAYMEVSSMLGVVDGPLKQCAARIVSY